MGFGIDSAGDLLERLRKTSSCNTKGGKTMGKCPLGSFFLFHASKFFGSRTRMSHCCTLCGSKNSTLSGVKRNATSTLHPKSAGHLSLGNSCGVATSKGRGDSLRFIKSTGPRCIFNVGTKVG